MSFSLADLKRAKMQSSRDLADALDIMAGANRDMKQGVERLPIAGDAWQGVSGDAAHHQTDVYGKYLGGHAEAQHGAAGKIRRAADEFEGVQQLLKKIENDAASGKFTINLDTGEVTPPKGDYDKNELDYLTNTLKQIRAAGETANADLTAAIKAAKELPEPSGSTGALPLAPGSAVKPGGSLGALQNLAAANPDGDPGATKAAAAVGGDTQANYKEWYPKAPETGDKLTVDPSKAGSFSGTVGALSKLPGTPKPPDGFGTGVARQFGQGVNNAIDGMIDEAKSKVGLNGADKFKDAWIGTAKDLQNETVKQVFPGIGMAQDAKSAIDQAVTAYQHPEVIPKNIGGALAQGSAVAVTGPLAGEAAAGARGLLGDATIAGRGGLLDMPGLPHDAPPVPGHGPVEPPSVHPGPVADHPVPTVDHPAPPAVGDHSMPNTPHDSLPPVSDHPAPTVGDHWSPKFDPNGGQHYASGDPHHPGGWPPGTPEATWSKGDPNPGWEHINRGPVKDWMDYQAQISGVERTPDGRIPEYVRIDPETGDPVKFDGHTFRGDQEVYLDAKQGYSALATDVGKPWANGMADGLLKEIPRQLDAMPPGAILEVHVSDPVGAQAIRKLLDNADLYDVNVIYTPKAP
ncbi:Tox-REase-5 domain-containing protein [Mycobacteroides abscessus]|nr:Tox-REase-5 domain-containing protein [Mycobacteroides abscessus]MDM2408519.1 Tox-REase-5 domain-containing protein [Mycobacteroides abscessus]